MVTSEQLKAECLRRRYAALLEKPDTFPSGNNWAYIIEQRMDGLGPALYRKYLVAAMLDEERRSGLHTTALKHFPEYLRAVSRDHALDTVYGDCETLPSEFVRLVTDCELFDAPRLAAMLRGGLSARQLVASCLTAFQPEYDADDLRDMEALLEALQSLPALGRVEERRTLLGLRRLYVCPQGHCSNADNEYCPECGMDIFGLNEDQRRAVNEFAERCEALRELI
ncbi:MAG: hypothetical protein K2H03_05715 [Muribaculaceae bacterium]|nr:hypothetical protein [Muribaculaceae bacterium]